MRKTLVAVTLVLAACGSGSRGPLRRAPEPAVSGPAQANLPGRVRPLPGTPEGVVVTRTGQVAVAVRDPAGLVLFDLARPDVTHFVVLPGAARHLALGGPDGPVLVPDEQDDRLIEVQLPDGTVTDSVAVGRQPHDAAGAGGGAVLVGDELASTVHVVRNGATTAVVAAPLQPGGVAASVDGSAVLAVGVRGRRVTAYRPDGSAIGSAQSGDGPTHVVAGNDGVFWVADTNGNAVLGFRVTDRHVRQVARIAVATRPYGLAFDHRRSTLWVASSATNTITGLRLHGTVASAQVTFNTVRQPNSVAVYEPTGALVVAGATPDGSIQLIPATP